MPGGLRKRPCKDGDFHNIPKVVHNGYPENPLDIHKSVDIMNENRERVIPAANPCCPVTKSFKFVEIALAIETTCLYNNGVVGENVKKWPEMGGFYLDRQV